MFDGCIAHSHCLHAEQNNKVPYRKGPFPKNFLWLVSPIKASLTLKPCRQSSCSTGRSRAGSSTVTTPKACMSSFYFNVDSFSMWCIGNISAYWCSISRRCACTGGHISFQVRARLHSLLWLFYVETATVLSFKAGRNKCLAWLPDSGIIWNGTCTSSIKERTLHNGAPSSPGRFCQKKGCFVQTCNCAA